MKTSVDVLGVGVHPLTWSELLACVGEFIAAGVPRTIAYANVHVINTAARNAPLRDFLTSVDVCYCDGNGVVLGAKLLGREIPERMTGADWIWSLAEVATDREWRVYWIGGAPGITEAAAEKLKERHPALQIATDHGYHAKTGPENDTALAKINAFAPHIVLVGMGTPLQEQWVNEVRASLNAPVVWCLGATADFISGTVQRPGPEWLVENHEWLSRLIADPRRLWQRYLIGNTAFLARVVRARLLR
ncbi:MAG: N-acetylglucosaminyldiphosphoundecaprenol N-acetyl-beta-D-mannosaminyltransferase [Myxococcota bacterium]|jgi:N-acetylglucosaminyldiphosphoundecaprenol N-acetyl-beta-D-mannosaminyltransferase